ncbi:MAG: AraC family transcriptional regulator [Pseudomonadota bacterium]
MGDVGLERLCRSDHDAIRLAPSEDGIERIEARFHGNGFDLHRHDTYAIGLTISGVQTFNYRGEARASKPGQVIVIHPDEFHDGGAGTEVGLRYRMIYIPPEFVSQALQQSNGKCLPFVAAPVLSDPRFRQSLSEALEDIDQPIGELKRSSLLAELAMCLSRHSTGPRARGTALNWPVLKLCSDFLRECSGESVRISELEGLTGMDRFTLSRQFKKAFGTSPHRYLVMRRLESVKRLLANGASLVDAAVDSGFADQSHMTRHFKRAFGMTPGHWQRLSTARTERLAN